MMKKIAVVTGASSGFGLLTSLELAKNGFHVIATMRNVEKQQVLLVEATARNVAEHIQVEQLDVTDEHSLQAFQSFLQTVDRVDVLVNNAGYAGGGCSEEVRVEEYRRQFETNVFGAISVTQLVLPYMRKRKSGKIINISSISGKVGFPGLSPYVSSKYALEGWSESLRLEVKPFGVDVVLVEPGSYDTNIWQTGQELLAENDYTHSPYRAQIEKIQTHINGEKDSLGNPTDIAKKIASIAVAKKTTLRYPIGKGVKFTIFMKSLLPWTWWERIVLKQFQKIK
ncbi:oxidoreductase [Priestia taiwanensis]|uniref:glucose 1-dehydrogenase [NAD(P)(+)] n=1 Tax=Priestia taiwanensis TaxID=1347902 RepID=A0A917AKG0_9BACI|nr:oxidoreductase [Priestia taiwanensis]MBM7361928.1 NAD(P)-dependent dehydrogenase (short-subunit alcohol dehydrogenase family) [Priestia taiwanensis]GGE58079.1 short-chain dehydrogenase/reductase [Priestia taiwanensis]